jgi:thiol:disulfide interchange protein DsbD
LLVILALAFAAWIAPERSATAGGLGEHLRAELVVETLTIQPGKEFLAGLKFEIDEHWHIYWVNAGFAGEGPKYAWTLPAGWSASPILWPAPVRVDDKGSGLYCYEGRLVLPASITVPADAPEGKTRITLQPDWLVCSSEECIQREKGSPPITIEVVVSRSPPEPSPHAPLFDAAKRLWPKPFPDGVKVSASEVEKALEFRVAGQGPWSDPAASLYLFALEELEAEKSGKKIARAVVNPNVLQPVRREGDATILTLPYPKGRKVTPAQLRGMFVVESKGERLPFAVALQVPGGGTPPANAESGGSATPPPGTAPAPAPETPRPPEPAAAVQDEVVSQTPTEEPEPFLLLLFFAFLGGVILNLMPCVLPVLSIKILGFVSQADEEPARVRRHGYAFALGVLVSFWVLAGLIQGLKAAGDGVGWGFQLQYAGTNAVLAALMLAVGLNLFGVFEMGTSVMNLAGGAAGKVHSGGYAGSFWSGILATAIATPCTAPFMAGAVGYAMTAPAFESFLLFTLLGLGMATPYVLLTMNPRLLKKVPRPGPWMETFKRVLAFPMIAVAAWLVGVFGKQTNLEGVKWLLYALVVLSVGLWVYGNWGRPERSTGVRRIGYLVALLIVGLSVAFIVRACHEKPPAIDEGLDDPANVTAIGPPTGEWEPWTPRLVQRYLRAGYPVFVDFTADWCQSCKFNENFILDTAAVHEAVKKYQYAMLQGDFTSEDATILKTLNSFGRSGVPVYLVYTPAPGVKPEMLPQVFTSQMVVDAMKRAATHPNVPERTASLPPAPPAPATPAPTTPAPATPPSTTPAPAEPNGK